MEKNIALLILSIVAIAVLLAFLPERQANTQGLILLTHKSEALEAMFNNGKLKQEIVDSINQDIQDVPEQIFELFGNDRINLYLTLENGAVRDYYSETRKNRLVGLWQGVRDEATIEVRLNEQTLDQIIEAGDPAKEFLEKLDSGEIKHNGLTLEGHVKSGAVGVSTKIISIITGTINFFFGFLG